MPNITIYVVTAWHNLPTKDSAIDATNLNHIETGIKNVTDFVNTLNVENGKVMGSAAFTTALLNKLNGIEAQANKYILPVATNTELGGVKVDNSTIVIENGVIRATTSGITELEELSDVNLTDLADGQILKYDEDTGKWVNTSEAEVRTQLSLLEDVDIDDASLEDGQVLKYNGTSEMWENGEGGGDVLGYDETLDILGLPPNPIYRFRIATPVMTSNTTPSGVASASSEHSSTTAAWAAFKQADVNEGWATSYGQITNAWIQYKFDNPKVIKKLHITLRDVVSYGMFKAFDFQASNNGADWTTLLSANNIVNTPGSSYDYSIDNDDAYYYYRIFITDTGGYTSDHIGLKRFDMYEPYLA